MSIINDVDCTYRKCDVTPLIFDLSTSLMLYIVIMIGEITEEDIEEEIKKE